MARPKPKTARRPTNRAARPTNATPTAQPEVMPAAQVHSSALFGGLRLIALMSATIVALVVYEVLQKPLGFWPGLIIGLVAGVIARALLLWVERIWLRAVVRRASAQQAAKTSSSKRT